MYTTTDPELSVTNEMLVFMDAWDNLDGTGGVGQYSVAALFWDADLDLSTPRYLDVEIGLPTIYADTVGAKVTTDHGSGAYTTADVSNLDATVSSRSTYNPATDSVIVDVSAAEATDGLIAKTVDATWDELLTGSSHNLNTSAGRRLRTLAGNVVLAQTVIGPGTGNNQIQLNGDASAVDGAYDPAAIVIVNGTGIGQSRLILQYNGTTKTATVDRNWKVNPDGTSEVVIYGDPGREHVNEGLAQAGSINTITLNTLASSSDNAYVGQVIFIRSGTGEDQACRITSYNGTTKIATVAKNWTTIPDGTSGYVMLAGSIFDQYAMSSIAADTVYARLTDGSNEDVFKATEVTISSSDSLHSIVTPMLYYLGACENCKKVYYPEDGTSPKDSIVVFDAGDVRRFKMTFQHSNTETVLDSTTTTVVP